ncbi:juvenile hormone esterase-like [Topomyia yanbarensis]|uniref:juvenile hormone esterase-like n=1 Tax=Topomyia yanbarensis TaxID=2498891 RepID=UPI00273C5C2A|nr:juvenile hormone esterase-like [Topomyia yanbarensis]
MSVLVLIGVLGGLGIGSTGATEQEVNPCSVIFGDGSSGVGVLNRTFNGVPYCEYLGIRYAEPPVGQLRFKSPFLRVPRGLENYTKVGNICAQLDTLEVATNVLGDEDCLFLNVYSPAIPKGSEPNRKYPVLVYIHGGSYAIWSSQTDMFGVDLLIENEVVIVSFNYRLFVLGFLRHPDFNVSGNFGLKDQLSALQWVQQFIEPFGGDPSNVTIIGQSVGAHSVTYHLYLEPFSGLFHRAIVMSGSLLAPSAMIYEPERFTPKYLKAINISTKEQLMNAPFQDLFLRFPQHRRFVFASIGLPIFLPTVEDVSDPAALVTKPAHELILSEPINQVPLMIGMTAAEFVPYFSSSQQFSADENFPNRDKGKSLTLVLNMLRTANVLTKRIDPNGAGRHFYGKFGDLANMYYPVKKLLSQLHEHGPYQAPIYHYRFEFDGKFGKYKNQYYKEDLDMSYGGAMHGDDLGYLFSPYNLREALANRSEFETEWKVAEINVEQIGNFVKYGNPTPNYSERVTVLWQPFNGNNSVPQYMNINVENEMRKDDDSSNLVFRLWKKAHNCLFYYECLPVQDLHHRMAQLLELNRTDVNLEGIFDDDNIT